jgi:hypothetical protein
VESRVSDRHVLRLIKLWLRVYLAQVEMRLVLSMLSRNFSMELATSPDSIKEIAEFTMMPNAMPVRFRSLH